MHVSNSSSAQSYDYSKLEKEINETCRKVADAAKKVFLTIAAVALIYMGSQELYTIPNIGPLFKAIGLISLGYYCVHAAQNKERKIPSCLTPCPLPEVPCGEREVEIAKMRRFLTIKKNVNSVCLVGPAGCGKTTLAREFAYRCPQFPGFENATVYELSLESLLSNTSLRGQLEGKVEELKNFLQHADENVIIYFDEAHRLYENPNASNPYNIANSLKPLLASGKFRMIAATTDYEYELIKKDPALSRRFHGIDLQPLTFKQIAATFVMHKKRLFEREYHVQLSREILLKALVFSEQLEGTFPDKAIKLVNLCCTTASDAIAPVKTKPTSLNQMIANLVSRAWGITPQEPEIEPATQFVTQKHLEEAKNCFKISKPFTFASLAKLLLDHKKELFEETYGVTLSNQMLLEGMKGAYEQPGDLFENCYRVITVACKLAVQPHLSDRGKVVDQQMIDTALRALRKTLH